MNVLSDSTALDVATALTLLGLVAASVRLFLGPSRSDRIVALDLITVLLIAISALAALRFDEAAYLDLGLTLALVGFLATVAFARYVESEPAAGQPARSADTSETAASRLPPEATAGTTAAAPSSWPHGTSSAEPRGQAQATDEYDGSGT